MHDLLCYSFTTIFFHQELLKIYLDCDSDALRFVVRQQGQGFCHQDTWSCFGPTGGVPALMRTLEQRKATAPPGSYTDRLYKDDQLLNAKLLEEAEELCEAQSKEEVAWEAADVLYFALVKCAKAGSFLKRYCFSFLVRIKVILLDRFFSNFVNTLTIMSESKRCNKKGGCPTSFESYS